MEKENTLKSKMDVKVPTVHGVKLRVSKSCDCAIVVSLDETEKCDYAIE